MDVTISPLSLVGAAVIAGTLYGGYKLLMTKLSPSYAAGVVMNAYQDEAIHGRTVLGNASQLVEKSPKTVAARVAQTTNLIDVQPSPIVNSNNFGGVNYPKATTSLTQSSSRQRREAHMAERKPELDKPSSAAVAKTLTKAFPSLVRSAKVFMRLLTGYGVADVKNKTNQTFAGVSINNVTRYT